MQFPICDLDTVAIAPNTTWRDVIAVSFDLPSTANRVAIQTPNHPKIVALLLAVWRQGGEAVLIHPRFPKGWVDELARSVEWDLFVDSYDSHETRPEQTPLEVDPESIASILFTSGSRGIPKPVSHTFAAHIASAKAANERMPFGPGDRWYVSLPLCHVGGLSLIFRAAVGGGAIQFGEKGEPLADGIVRLKPTHLSLVPAQLRKLVEHPQAVDVLRNLNVLLIGGGPLNAKLFDRCVELELPVRQTYGMTETASQCSTGEPFAPHCGTPLAGRELKIIDGEIRVRGTTLGSYLDGETLDDSGWLHTGDLGRLDEDGNLFVTGRRDNMFVSGGENVQPETIEAAFLASGYAEAIAVAVPDVKFGHRAFLFLDRDISDDEKAAIEGTLPNFMKPIGYRPLPKTDALKRSRPELAELARLFLGGS